MRPFVTTCIFYIGLVFLTISIGRFMDLFWIKTIQFNLGDFAFASGMGLFGVVFMLWAWTSQNVPRR